MTEKNKILESWIMVEHLSEGDINLNNKVILTLNDLQGQDFYSLFLQEIEKKKWDQRKKGGVVVYFDVFRFQEVEDMLRVQYGLEKTDEDIRFGNKFSFALYFDRDLNFLTDMTFFTESAYIRYFKQVPHEEEFREFEENLKNQFSHYFDETVGEPEKFNAAMQKVLLRYGIDVTNCRMQITGNIETEVTNLHSFFIDDLEKAKRIKTANLDAYLYGNKKEHINLDSKKDSMNFHSHVFEQILQPENYPLGRFPSNTRHALSLMQQVAVNLSIGFDDNQMRSVNGPPGTGKTTLLKDIFAQLVVQQAYDIAKLSGYFIKGTEKTIYYNSASIGELPKCITENNIVVASSNNGAVQNIVNELPLIKHIHKYLDDEYLPDQDIYKQFLKHYEEVKAIQAKIQKYADNIRAYREYNQKLEHVRANYQKELENKENELCAELQKLAEIEQKCRQRLAQLQSCLKETQNRAETIRQNMTSVNQCLQVHKRQRLYFFSGKKKKEKYRSRLNEITAQLVKLSDEDIECSNQRKEIYTNILLCQTKLRRSTEEQTELQRKFACWKMAEVSKISNLEKRVHEYENIRNDSETEPLNMNQEYDDLQKSNPWFDEAYRVAQNG